MSDQHMNAFLWYIWYIPLINNGFPFVIECDVTILVYVSLYYSVVEYRSRGVHSFSITAVCVCVCVCVCMRASVRVVNSQRWSAPSCRAAGRCGAARCGSVASGS